MPASAKGALLHVWALGTLQTPEASWPSRDALVELLELDGFTTADYEALVSARWLDVDEDGRVWVHDWPDHQYQATQAIARAYDAARKRTAYWKRKDVPPSPAPLTPETRPDKKLHDRSPQTSGESPETGWESFGGKWAPFKEAWTRYGLRLPPSERQREKLWQIVDAGPLRVSRWIAEASPNLTAYDLVQYLFRRQSQLVAETPPDELPGRQPDDDAAETLTYITAATNARR